MDQLCEICAITSFFLSKADVAQCITAIFPAEPGRVRLGVGLPSATASQLELATICKAFALAEVDCISLKP